MKSKVRSLLVGFGLFFFSGVSFAAVDRVVVEGLFDKAAVLNVDGKRRMVRAGKSTPEGVKLISANSRQAIVEINGQLATLLLHQSIGGGYAKREKKEVSISKDALGQYRMQGSINGQLIDFLVDTGASVIAMNSSHAAKLGIDFRVEGEKSYAETASGVVNTYEVTLRDVEVGGLHVPNVRAMVIVGSHPSNVLLGMTYLSAVKIVENEGLMVLQQKY